VPSLLQDLRYGLRMLRTNPGFSAIAIAALALGIGANTAIFSLVDAVLLRPLPFPDPDRLVMVWEDASRIGFPQNTPAPANFFDWKAQNHVFEDMAAIDWRTYNLTGDGEPEKLDAFGVTANFFSLLGIRPALGRVFAADEDTAGANKVVLISYGLWQRRYGAERSLIGRPIQLNNEKVTVIGVMPPRFQFLGKDTQVFAPIAFTPRQKMNRGSHYLAVFARMKPGVSLGQARTDIDTITRRIAHDYPQLAADLAAIVLPLREQLAGKVRFALVVLVAAVGCVLLIACANVANLLLSRGAARSREIAVRLALGARRWRLVRQLLTESMLLAVLSASLGLLLARWSLDFLSRLVPEGMENSAATRLDVPVLLYAVALSILTALIFGLVPALRSARLDLNDALKQGGGKSATGSHSRLRATLVVSEVALSLVLLAGGGLLIETFLNLRGMDLGFRPHHVLRLKTKLAAKYSDLARRTAFYQGVLDRVRTLPGVQAAAYTTAVPLTWKGGTNYFSIEGHTQRREQDAICRQVTSDYFRAMGMTLRQGRIFDAHDSAGAPRVAIINETMARSFWTNENALDKRYKLGDIASPAPWITIVGIVADVKQMGLEVPAKAEMYFPGRQAAEFWNAPQDLVIRTAGDPLKLAAAVRHEITAVDPNQPVSNVQTMDEIVGTEVSDRRMQMLLLGSFAILALVLASVGIYGVLSYAVAQRTREIGLRMALGAQRGEILRMVLREGMGLALAGLAAGMVTALALARLMSSLLFGVKANDPATFGAVSLLLLAVASLACWVPARRAVKIDPMAALRYE
jgi:predicted permease